MKVIFELEKHTAIDSAESYIVSYPHLIRFTKSVEGFSATEVIALSHMVYGWMPTILRLHISEDSQNLDEIARILQYAREIGSLSHDELAKLKALINNSIVGASKLLHFVAPEHFPIWDSRVYRFCYENEPYPYRVNSVDQYQSYMNQLDVLMKDSRLPAFHASVNEKLGYEVSPVRAIELVMFLNSEN